MTTILAIETSCDETSAAVIRDGRVLSNIVSSQINLPQLRPLFVEDAATDHGPDDRGGQGQKRQLRRRLFGHIPRRFDCSHQPPVLPSAAPCPESSVLQHHEESTEFATLAMSIGP